MKKNDTKTEYINSDLLLEHPKNYRVHPDDQLEHLMKSIEQNGFYRNVVIAKDNTILAGHGVVKASRKLGLTSVPVIRLDIDSNSSKALKVLAGDNELGKLAEVNDRALSEVLKEIMSKDGMVSLSGIPEDATDIMINKNHEEGERNSINHPDEQIDEELMGNPGIDDMADGGKVEEPEMGNFDWIELC